MKTFFAAVAAIGLLGCGTATFAASPAPPAATPLELQRKAADLEPGGSGECSGGISGLMFRATLDGETYLMFFLDTPKGRAVILAPLSRENSRVFALKMPATEKSPWSLVREFSDAAYVGGDVCSLLQHGLGLLGMGETAGGSGGGSIPRDGA